MTMQLTSSTPTTDGAGTRPSTRRIAFTSFHMRSAARRPHTA
ncbi:MAG: hypothetical protein ACRDVG_15700 [Jatrophihabitantaceae bacterium]